MSGGGEQTTTSEASVPKEFKSFLFGTPATPGTFGGELTYADIGISEQSGPKPGSVTYWQEGKGAVDPATAKLLLQQAQLAEGQYTPGTEGTPGLLQDAQKLYEEGGFAPSQAFGATSQQALAQQKDLASQLSQSFLPQVQQAWNRPYENMSESIADIATQNLRRDLSRNVLPTITGGAIGAGQMGSSRQGIAEGLARSEAERNISDLRSQILFQGQEMEAQQAARQLSQAPMVAQLLGLPAGLLSEVGSIEDQLANQEASRDYQNLLGLSQIIQGFIPGASVTQTTPRQGPNPLGAVAGGAATGFSIGGPWGAAIGGGLGLLSTL